MQAPARGTSQVTSTATAREHLALETPRTSLDEGALVRPYRSGRMHREQEHEETGNSMDSAVAEVFILRDVR